MGGGKKKEAKLKEKKGSRSQKPKENPMQKLPQEK